MAKYKDQANYQFLRNKISNGTNFFEGLSDNFPSSQELRSKAKDLRNGYDEILVLADNQIVSLEHRIEELEEKNSQLSSEIYELEESVDSFHGKKPQKTLEDVFKEEMLEELSKKYSLSQLSDILKPFL
jgi:predicted RNase H-like nuclease (RuvC/YqgF family)